MLVILDIGTNMAKLEASVDSINSPNSNLLVPNPLVLTIVYIYKFYLNAGFVASLAPFFSLLFYPAFAAAFHLLSSSIL